MSEDDIRIFRRAKRFIREFFDEIAAGVEEYIAKGRIPAHGVGFIVGPSGSFKTFLAIDFAAKVASGAWVLEGRTHKGGVVYISAEAPNGSRKRIQAWRQVHKASGLPFQLIAQAPNLCDREDIAELAEEVRLAADDFGDLGLSMIVIDTLAASIAGVDENSAAQMSLVLANARWLADQTNAFVLIVTHTGKEEGRGIRGWSGQHAAADMVISMTRDDGADCATGRLTKLKEGESGYRFSIKLEQVKLGADQDGDSITSAVVIYEDAPEPKPRKGVGLKDAELLVLTAIGYLSDNGPTTIPPASIAGVRKSDRAVTRAAVRERALEAGFAVDDEKPNTITKRFSRALEKLVVAGKIRVEGELVWLL